MLDEHEAVEAEVAAMPGEWVTVTRLEGGQKLRQGTITGFAPEAPEMGRSFYVYAEPLSGEREDTREFRTSAVQDVDFIDDVDDAFILTTLNSVYRVELVHTGRPGVA